MKTIHIDWAEYLCDEPEMHHAQREATLVLDGRTGFFRSSSIVSSRD